MKIKKILSGILAASMVFALTACGTSSSGAAGGAAETKAEAADTTAADESKASDGETEAAASGNAVSKDDLKVGVIFVGDENEGYTAAHYEGIKSMISELGLSEDQVIIKFNIPEGDECLTAAQDLADQGCQIVFSNSFGHEDYMIQAAKEFPDVQFCAATGYQAQTSGLDNMHNFFTSVYESRYVSGVVAGLKLNEMIKDGKITEDKAKMGYVGAYPYAEVISGFTAFYLGAKSVCPTVTMEVNYTSSWADQALEL